MRIHCIQQTYRDIGIFSRLNAGRVQNFCTEVSQLGCFFKVKLTNRSCLVDNTRVVVMHTVDVCPNLDFGSVYGCSDQGSGVIAATTLQVVYLTVSVAADETLCDVDVHIRIEVELRLQLLLNIYRIRLCVLVSTHEFQSRKQYGLRATFLQVEVYHSRRNELALCQNHFLFEQSEKVFRVGTDVVEVRLDDFKTFLFIFLGCEKFINVLFIFSLQLIDNLVGTLRILLIQIVRNFHQCVCRT